ncbi:MAG: FkbM family methyltransferase [Gammaproteobacteria bacterium]|nr:FkbM family methyltransferase [Gammaproteobacteria bacterium]
MRALKKIIRSFGFDISRYNPESSEIARLMAMLNEHCINLVLDVGANTGGFGKLLRDANYQGRIVSFEPLSSAWDKLLIESRKDSLWEIAPRTALGAEDGEIDINIAGNSESSSVLAMLDAHASAAPESCYVDTERTPLHRLDSIIPDYLHPESVPFLKIDAQGYEDRVLMGAKNFLEKTIGLQLELSLTPLYQEQCLYDDLIQQLKNMGFELWAISPVFTDHATGRLLQVDATFFRN